MVSKLKTFDLDTSSPRGWCKLGEPGDATEHGHRINDEDIQRLKEHYNLQVSEHIVNNNKYRLISLLNEGATDTVVSILGGDGKYYVIDSTILPDGLVMPLFEYYREKKLNVVIIDPEYALEHAWNSFLVGYLPNNVKAPILKKVILKNSNDDRLLEKLPWWKNVKTFTEDMEKILKHIKDFTSTDLWLMGHCSGATMTALIHDLNRYNDLYNGMILLNPYWQQRWESTLDTMDYFLVPPTKSVLVIQHRDDRTIGANTNIAKKIVENAAKTTKSTYVEMQGGTDQGSPTFSMGYHGFRDLEREVIEHIQTFIKNN